MKKYLLIFVRAIAGLALISYSVLGLTNSILPGARSEIFVLMLFIGAAIMVWLMMEKK